MTHRNEPEWKPFYERAYGKRPREELFDLKKDPDEMHNVAADPDYAGIRAKLEKQLLGELKSTDDPRMVDDGRFFETPPMTDP